jgi:predicted exporter
MIRILLGAFIVAHGLLTAFIWVSPPNQDAPFRVTHSWLLGDARPLAVVIALVAAVGFMLAGVAFIGQQAWWAVTGIGAGMAALLLMALYFNPWLLAGIAISAGILYAGIQALPQA